MQHSFLIDVETRLRSPRMLLEAAAGNEDSGEEVMALLLDRRGDQITITENVPEAAASNKESGQKITALILSRHRDQITFTEDVVKAAAAE